LNNTKLTYRATPDKQKKIIIFVPPASLMLRLRFIVRNQDLFVVLKETQTMLLIILDLEYFDVDETLVPAISLWIIHWQLCGQDNLSALY
jgi:hypothetical protein